MTGRDILDGILRVARDPETIHKDGQNSRCNRTGAIEKHSGACRDSSRCRTDATVRRWSAPVTSRLAGWQLTTGSRRRALRKDDVCQCEASNW